MKLIQSKLLVLLFLIIVLLAVQKTLIAQPPPSFPSAPDAVPIDGGLMALGLALLSWTSFFANKWIGITKKK